MKIDKIEGSVLGLALGDAFGAPYEGGILERAVWSLLGTENGMRRWTDDTQMSIDVMESLIKYGSVNQNDLASRFAASYRWSRGYGPAAAKILKRIRGGESWKIANRSIYPNGSFGNGGAMRAPAVGLFFAQESEENIINAAYETAIVTHAHPLGLEGAGLIALATALSLKGTGSIQLIERLLQHATLLEFTHKLNQIQLWLQDASTVSSQTVAVELGNGITADASCVTAIYVALVFREASFDELLEFIIKLGGDVDTIAAMAGAIWGAYRGFNALSEEKLAELEARVYLQKLSKSLEETF